MAPSDMELRIGTIQGYNNKIILSTHDQKLWWNATVNLSADATSYSGDVSETTTRKSRGGRVERRCWVNFQCRGVLLVWLIVGQGPIALAVGAGGGLFGHFFSHLSFLFSFSLSLGDGPI